MGTNILNFITLQVRWFTRDKTRDLYGCVAHNVTRPEVRDGSMFVFVNDSNKYFLSTDIFYKSSLYVPNSFPKSARLNPSLPASILSLIKQKPKRLKNDERNLPKKKQHSSKRLYY